MQVVPFGPKRVKPSEIKDYKSSWQHIQSKVNNQREEILQEKKSLTNLGLQK